MKDHTFRYRAAPLRANGSQGRGKIDGSKIVRGFGGYRQTEDGRYFFLGFQGFVQTAPESSRHLRFCIERAA